MVVSQSFIATARKTTRGWRAARRARARRCGRARSGRGATTRAEVARPSASSADRAGDQRPLDERSSAYGERDGAAGRRPGRTARRSRTCARARAARREARNLVPAPRRSRATRRTEPRDAEQERDGARRSPPCRPAGLTSRLRHRFEPGLDRDARAARTGSSRRSTARTARTRDGPDHRAGPSRRLCARGSARARRRSACPPKTRKSSRNV